MEEISQNNYEVLTEGRKQAILARALEAFNNIHRVDQILGELNYLAQQTLSAKKIGFEKYGTLFELMRATPRSKKQELQQMLARLYLNYEIQKVSQ